MKHLSSPWGGAVVPVVPGPGGTLLNGEMVAVNDITSTWPTYTSE